MKYEDVCDIYEKLESTTKGLKKTEIIAGFFGKIKDEPEIIYLTKPR